ncbi:MAG TPA: hypothetical protein PK340_01145 [Bacilli bacterium]|nr:hypothetical protein [Bacilli bacterium]
MKVKELIEKSVGLDAYVRVEGSNESNYHDKYEIVIIKQEDRFVFGREDLEKAQEELKNTEVKKWEVIITLGYEQNKTAYGNKYRAK